MSTNDQKFYSELRKTQQELITSLQSSTSSPKIKQWIKEELQDIEQSIEKLTKGDFGKCEISGELIPYEWLSLIPTIKTVNDVNTVSSYFRKSFY